VDRNTLLAFALSMLVFTIWVVWQAERRADMAPESDQPVAEESMDRSEQSIEIGERERKAERQPEATPSPGVEVEPEVVETGDEPEPWSRRYELERYVAEVSNRGASLRLWRLPGYRQETEAGRKPVEIVPEGGAPAGLPPVLATPLRELGIGDLSQAVFEVDSAGGRSVSFVLSRGGLVVRKRYGFDEDGYGFRLGVEVENASDRVVSPRFEVVWPAGPREGSDFVEQSFAALTDGSLERQLLSGLGKPGFLGFTGSEDTVRHRDVAWAGVDNKYFLGALLPDRERGSFAVFEAVEPGVVGLLTVGFDPVELPPGGSLDHEFRGYAGPKKPEALDGVSVSLEQAINRGWSWIAPLTRFFEWMLKAIHSFVGNYGVAIIVLTVLVRVVTAPIMSRQMRSMERMRTVQPKLKELQEKYADDRQKQSEAMMELYRREGVNPLGGCLPMLLQFPVFIGLFYALQSSFELRQADFMLWIDDLSVPEALFTIPGMGLPVRVLPLIMGASMVLQQRLTPTSVDPAQARMMMTIMPIMFTVLFYQFPSGLVLYWMVSNLLGIAHQLWVGRRMRSA